MKQTKFDETIFAIGDSLKSPNKSIEAASSLLSLAENAYIEISPEDLLEHEVLQAEHILGTKNNDIIILVPLKTLFNL